MPEHEDPQEQSTRGIVAAVPVASAKPDGSAGVRCVFYWTVGETTEEELREVHGMMLERAISVFRQRNGSVLN